MTVELVTGHAGKAHISSADAGQLNTGVYGSCLYVLGSAPAVTMTDANTLSIPPCELLLEGRYVRLTGTNTLTIASGSQSGYRIDRIVLRYALAHDGTEDASLVVVQGTTSTDTATLPTLPNSGSVLDGSQTVDWEIARVSLSALTPTATWLLPQLPTLAALGDSVSQSTKFERLYDDDRGWHIWHMGKLVMVSASGVVISGGGSWDSATCPYTMPSGLRPPESISTGGMSRDGALSTLLYVESGGAISINNAGGAGKANVSRYGSLTYMAG